MMDLPSPSRRVFLVGATLTATGLLVPIRMV